MSPGVLWMQNELLTQGVNSPNYFKNTQDWALAPLNVPNILPSDLELEHKRVVLVH
jgi:hypothetical protein